MNKLLFLILASVLMLGFSNPTQEIFELTSKVDKNVLQKLGDPGSRIPILVVLKDQADLSGADVLQSKDRKNEFVYNALRQVALTTQVDLVNFLSTRALEFKRFYIVNMIAVYDADAALVSELVNRTDVAKVYDNANVKVKLPTPSMTFLDQLLGGEPGEGTGENIVSTGADKVWNELKVKGEQIVIAGQDTGVQWDHPALRNSYRGLTLAKQGEILDHNYNWHDSIKKPIGSGSNKCGYDTKAPCDDDQHGTHTMGTMIGDDGGTNQIGMAPKAKWIACRNMDAGTGNPASYIECFEFFLAPYPYGGNAMTDGDPTKAPHIINNSWGCPSSEGCQGGEILPVLQAMKKAGVMVVVSAGNEGPGCSSINDQPASHTDVTLSVGAHNHRSGMIASFSSRGPSIFDGGIGPDVTAPGVDVRSAVPGGSYAGSMWSGTSMAGPHVVGEIALMWSANPKLIGNIEKTTELVRASSTPKTTTENCGNVSGSSVPNNTYGYGSINAHKAVQMALQTL